MTADGWETVTDLSTIREGEPMRVLGQEGWTGRRVDDRAWIDVPAGFPSLYHWLLVRLVACGQVERRAVPEPHLDDVALIMSRSRDFITQVDARALLRTLDWQRHDRGEQ